MWWRKKDLQPDATSESIKIAVEYQRKHVKKLDEAADKLSTQLLNDILGKNEKNGQ